MSSKNALRDITRAVNDISITDSANFQSQVLGAPVSALGDNKSTLQTEQPTFGAPHYMMSTSASKPQIVQSSMSTKPLRLTSLDSGTSRRQNWMSSASKRLGLSNKKIRESAGNHSGFERLPVSPYAPLKRPEIPSQIPIKRKSTTPAALSSPIPRKRQVQNKPLPSLPVATVTSASPVHRRSLIDATERPLRRSISPQLGHTEAEEWPALSPDRPLSSAGTNRKPTLLKPSIGESVIESMRELHLSDDEQPRNNTPATCISQTQSGDTKNDPILQPTCNTPSSRSSSETSVNRAASDESLIPSEKRQKLAPAVRQTKTSAMRIQLAGANFGGSLSPDANDMSNLHKHDGRASNNHNVSNDCGTARPIRSASRSRHAATPRGSPYLVQSRSNANLVRVNRKPVGTPEANSNKPTARSGSVDSTEEVRHSKVVAVRSVKGSGSKQRQSSVPLPIRLIRRLPDEDSEGEVIKARLSDPSDRKQKYSCDAQDADIDTDPEPKKSRRNQAEQVQHSGLLSFSEVMATPPPISNELHHDNDSDEDSIHGYDEEGGFKIKKVGGSGSKGATLRISDDAYRFLSPNHEEEPGEEVGAGSKRSSFTDLRQAVVLKEHLRRSSGLIKTQVQLTRSQTERSLARLSGVSSQNGDNDTGSVYSIPENGGLRRGPGPPAVELSAEPVLVAHTTSTVIHSNQSEGPQDKAVHSPSSARQGDWPLKDFETLASTAQATPAPTDSSMSPWIPPAAWDINVGNGDTSAMSELPETPVPPAPQNAPAAEAVTQRKQEPRPKRLSDASDRVPTTIPSYFSGTISRPVSTDPVKRPFPARKSSKQTVPQQSHGSSWGLSPVKESPERITGLRQPRKTYGNDLPVLQEPKNMNTFSESIGGINQGHEEVQYPKPMSKAPAPVTSGKKALSTLRGLLHKKSHEFRFGSRRGKKQAIDEDSKSSPLLATPTPYHNSSSLMNGLSPLQSDAVTPSYGKPVVQRKPTPASKTGHSLPSMENAILEPPEIRLATQTALKLLDMAREEGPGPRQTQFVDLGKATIEVVNAARETEKALEQAKQAAAKAEIQALTSRKAVADVVALVEKLLSGND